MKGDKRMVHLYQVIPFLFSLVEGEAVYSDCKKMKHLFSRDYTNLQAKHITMPTSIKEVTVPS